jgi:hypothetical protein
VIAGQPYVLLDMGRDGRLFSPKRTGIQALYSASIPLDTRYLTSYVRDVSVVTDDDYRRLDVPAQLSRFPVDLRQPGLEYSGLYEDGWVGERSFVKLRGGPAARLLIRADVPARSGQRLRVLVDGRPVFAQAVPAGPLEVRARVPASRSRRRVELIWGEAMQLPAPDLRPAAAFLKFVGVVPP